MVQKFKDAANILKAKLKSDQLEEALVQVTSEQNWQAPTNLLHEICTAAYNYQKWQRISQFIWEKLKKKNSWRKILKTLNLVDFLIRNGPPNTITTFKYQLYQFKAFQGFTHYSDSTDRGEPIREKSKSIVELLTNQQLLEEERLKAKNIKQRMSGIAFTGGNTGMGGNIGGGRYQGYDSKNYKNSSKSTTGGNIAGVGSTAYGDYSVHQSTLSKYKDKNQIKKKPITTETDPNLPDITGLGGNSNTTAPVKANQNITQTVQQRNQVKVEQKKPFEKQARKLRKPGAPSASTNITPAVQQQKVQQKQNTNQGSILDDDIFGFSSEPPSVAQKQTTNNDQPSITQQTGNLVNPMYSTTAQMASRNIQQNQSQSNPGMNILNSNPPVQSQTAQNQNPQYSPQNVNNYGQTQNQNPQYPPQNVNNYGQNFNHQYQQYQQNPHMVNPMYGTTAPMATQQNPNMGYQQHQNMGYQQQNQQYQNMGYQQPNQQMNWSLGQPQPQSTMNWNQPNQGQPQQNMGWNQPQNNSYGMNQNQGISLQNSQQPNQNSQQQQQNKQQNQQGNNVKWLSSEEKGLIDFSDFGSSVNTKKDNNEIASGSNSNNKGNNIQIDAWNW